MSAAGASVMAELRQACWPIHQRLEKRLDIKARFGSLGPYRAHLEKMSGFCAALEGGALPAAFHDALEDYLARRKVALLSRDLVALGLDAERISHLARCELPACTNVAAAFGSVYVMRDLALTAERGASFLASYGADTTAMWRKFGAVLEAQCDSEAQRASASQGAVQTFRSLEKWLCEAGA